MKEKKKSRSEDRSHAKITPKWLRLASIYISALLAVVVLVFGTFSVLFAGEVYPRVSVAGIMVGGLKPDEAKERLTSDLLNEKITPAIVTVKEGQTFTVKADDVEASYAIDQSVEAAMQVGRTTNFLTNITQKITAPLLGFELPAKVTVNETKLNDAVDNIAKSVDVVEKDAALQVNDGVASISPAVLGKRINTKTLKERILESFGNGEKQPIAVVIEEKEPKIKADALESVKKQAEASIANPLLFTYNNQSFTATPAIIGSWLEVKPVKVVLKTNAELHFNEEKIARYIDEIASKIDQEAQNARIAIIGGNVQIIESSKDGLALKRDVTKADVVRILTIRKELPTLASIEATPASSPAGTPSPQLAENQIALEVEVKKPDVTNDNINQIGIKERIAISATDFKNSPANRQENIKLGTKLFNGVILKPGQQFSSVKALGRIDAAAGFKPELVIKQDQLTPEIGGGLCQVSTTLFRAVMNAGLKVDERRNHRFRVSYYEAKLANPDPEDYVTINAKQLVGLDATIYDPSPDFKFTNDTDNYILIQGKVEGTRLTFELFGTKDGRKTTIDGPYITSTIPAPTEIQYIDDPTLPAGQTKVKERPAAGAKTYVKYIVEKEGKQIHNNTFSSSYVPWQAKHYRGTGPAAPASPTPESATTPSPAPTVAGTSAPAETPTPIPSPSV